ncbi:hypothetical protein SS50377_24377 [Spironucleus salmonicida]|uniref:Uncharacterized protein n=1 Tax=Spironucleus salmonicida TaxID=348837 RepID=V6LPA4_9EUKA|nr:hypothetical protein SS50377_24377 [Spironucleus salmonicida]|eukprot:EST46073.1 Hypothetical protein SS50377_14063 [Spironucleus salmonicida]
MDPYSDLLLQIASILEKIDNLESLTDDNQQEQISTEIKQNAEQFFHSIEQLNSTLLNKIDKLRRGWKMSSSDKLTKLLQGCVDSLKSEI